MLGQVARTSLAPFLPWRGTRAEILSHTQGARQARGQRGAGRKNGTDGLDGGVAGRARKTVRQREKTMISSPTSQQLPISFLPRALTCPLLATKALNISTIYIYLFVCLADLKSPCCPTSPIHTSPYAAGL